MDYSELKTKIEEIGIDNDVLQTESMAIGAFVGSVAENAFNQLTYDVMTNIPTGTLTREEVKGHALKQGVVSSISRLYDYDVIGIMEFCGDLLEDVNAHKEAALLRSRAKKEAVRP